MHGTQCSPISQYNFESTNATKEQSRNIQHKPQFFRATQTNKTFPGLPMKFQGLREQYRNKIVFIQYCLNVFMLYTDRVLKKSVPSRLLLN